MVGVFRSDVDVDVLFIFNFCICFMGVYLMLAMSKSFWQYLSHVVNSHLNGSQYLSSTKMLDFHWFLFPHLYIVGPIACMYIEHTMYTISTFIIYEY